MIAFMITLCGCEYMLSNTLNYLQNCALFVIKIKCSKVWSVSLKWSGLKIIPPMLKVSLLEQKKLELQDIVVLTWSSMDMLSVSVSSIVKRWYHECCMEWCDNPLPQFQPLAWVPVFSINLNKFSSFFFLLGVHDLPCPGLGHSG